MYLVDIARYGSSLVDPPTSAKLSNGTSGSESHGDKNDVAVENGKSSNGHPHDAVDAPAVDEKAESVLVTSMRKMSDGIVSPPLSETESLRRQMEQMSLDSPAVNKPNQSPPQQPKRLSIDPNCGTPLRDLLRRCDEIPGVIAMRSDSQDASRAEDALDVDAEKEWE